MSSNCQAQRLFRPHTRGVKPLFAYFTTRCTVSLVHVREDTTKHRCCSASTKPDPQRTCHLRRFLPHLLRAQVQRIAHLQASLSKPSSTSCTQRDGALSSNLHAYCKVKRPSDPVRTHTECDVAIKCDDKGHAECVQAQPPQSYKRTQRVVLWATRTSTGGVGR